MLIYLFIAIGFFYIIFLWIKANYYSLYKEGAIVVTGSSSGLGLHITKLLVKLGFIVYSTVRNEEDKIMLNNISNNIIPVILDVTDKNKCIIFKTYLKDDLKKRQLKLVGLINNAGISKRLPTELEDTNDIKKIFDVNVFGLLNITIPLIELLRDNGGGRIINIGSIAGYIPVYSGISYCSSKSSVNMISKVLRMELKEDNIAVSLIEPGTINTSICNKLIKKNSNLNIDNKLKNRYRNWIDSFERHRLKEFSNSYNVNVIDKPIKRIFFSNYPKNYYRIAGSGILHANIIYVINYIIPSSIENILNIYRSF